MAELVVQAAKTLPWAFRPTQPDQERPELKGLEVLVRGEYRGVVLSAYRDPKRGLLLYVRTRNCAATFPLEAVEPL